MLTVILMTAIPAHATKLDFKVTSPAFGQQAMSKRHTSDGEDRSPPIEWAGAPAGTRELALVCDDPDAPTPQPWVHWVLYGVPGDATALPEGIATTEQPPAPKGAAQGKNSWGTIGYRGPLPPPGSGWHRYRFTVYALDSALGLKPGLTKEQLLAAMKGHVLAETRGTGRYQR